MRKKISIFLLLIMTFTLVACGKEYTDEEIGKLLGTDELPYEYYFSEFVIDETDLTQMTTYVDYVFVGTVTGYEKTVYDADCVSTYYNVRVEENIKDELITAEDVVLVKDGGISEDNTKFCLCKNDILPKVGEKYVFCAYVMEYIDELYCFGPNTVCKIETPNISEDENYKKYAEALKTKAEDIYEGKHIVSRYDVNYSKEK